MNENEIGRPSLTDVLKAEGLEDEDVAFIVENRLVAQHAAIALQEICRYIRAQLVAVDGNTSSAESLRARQMLFKGALPTSRSDILTLRIATACLKVASLNPGARIKQKDVAAVMGIRPQRFSQQLSSLSKRGIIDFDQILVRLGLSDRM